MQIVNRQRYIRDMLPGLVDTKKPLHLLDAGCGTGRLLKHLVTAYPSWILHGVDASGDRCNECREKWPLLDIRCESVEHLSYPDGCMDVVVCSDVLEHLWEKQHGQAATELRRVLMDGGILIVTTPARKASDGLMRSLGHVSHLTAERIQGLCVGMSLIDSHQICKKSPNDPTTVMVFRK